MGENKHQFLRIKGVLPAIALVLFGAVLVLVSNFLLTDRANVAIQNSQTQAQAVKESVICQDTPEEEACQQSEKILNDPTSQVAGPQGIQGFQGLMGLKGDTGDRGPIGLTGPTGPIGPIGPIGEKGETGLQGFLGNQGLAGEPGLNGLKGDKGDPGINGIDGAPGKDGKDGAPGANGTYPTGVNVDCGAGTVTVTMSDGSVVGGAATCGLPAVVPPVVPDVPAIPAE